MKDLIVYFSYSNNTKKLVEGINKELHIDTIRVERKAPYSSDYDECAYVEAKEEFEKKIHPVIKPIDIDAKEYDRVLLFFPIWWYTIPMPIATFIEEKLNGYKGKVLVFANSYTNDPQYMVNSMRDLKEINPSIDFQTGLFNKSLKEHIALLKERK